MGVVLASQIAIYAVTYELHVAYEQTRVIVLAMYAMGASLTAAAVERRLWPAAATYAAIVVVATAWPAAAWPFESLANLVLTLNVVSIWRRSDAADTTVGAGDAPR